MTDEKEEKPGPVWEKREFVLNTKMREICKLGVAATEAEIKALRRKLEKLQYGGR